VCGVPGELNAICAALPVAACRFIPALPIVSPYRVTLSCHPIVPATGLRAALVWRGVVWCGELGERGVALRGCDGVAARGTGCAGLRACVTSALRRTMSRGANSASSASGAGGPAGAKDLQSWSAFTAIAKTLRK
jgi:hypothetical protein